MWHKNKSIALYLLHSERPPLTALTPRCTDAWLQVIKKKDLSLTKSPPNAKLFNCLSARITHGKKIAQKVFRGETNIHLQSSAGWMKSSGVKWRSAEAFSLWRGADCATLSARPGRLDESKTPSPLSPAPPPSLSQLFYRKHSAAINMQHQTANQTLVSREGENWRVWRERERRDGKTQRARTVQ